MKARVEIGNCCISLTHSVWSPWVSKIYSFSDKLQTALHPQPPSPSPFSGEKKYFRYLGTHWHSSVLESLPVGFHPLRAHFFLKHFVLFPNLFLYSESFILISDKKFPTIIFQEILYKKSGTYYISEKVVWCKDMRGSVYKLPNLFNTECIVHTCDLSIFVRQRNF